MSFCYTNNMAKRLLFLLRLYVTLLLLFVTQKLVFMLFNLPYAGAPPREDGSECSSTVCDSTPSPPAI